MAGKGGRGRGEGGTIVIKREEVVEGGHHGGAWKVAYADFVTAMMAFFLLMWLLNATTEEQRRGLADYFSPSNLFGRSTSGSGQPFGGTTANSAGQMVSDAGAIRVQRGSAPIMQDTEEEEDGEAPLAGPARTPAEPGNPLQPAQAAGGRQAAGLQAAGNQASGNQASGNQAAGTMASGVNQAGTQGAENIPEATLRAEMARRERASLEQAAEEIRQAVQQDRGLADLARHLLVDNTPEGLRVQLIDAERQAMFPLGGSVPNDRARALLQRVAQIVARLPNNISIVGHTDATPFRSGERSNWELSAERANSVRRLLIEAGIADNRIRSVAGMAERDPLIAEQPTAAGNRRVAITLLREAQDPPIPVALPAPAATGATPRNTAP